MRRRFIVLAAVVLLLTSCLNPVDVGIGLPKTSKGFCESMRWSDFQTASLYMIPAEQSAFLDRFQEDEDLKIVNSRVVKVDLNEDDGVAEVLYQMDYYRLPSNRIKKWQWTQRWVLIRESRGTSNVWLIENAPPVLPWTE